MTFLLALFVVVIFVIPMGEILYAICQFVKCVDIALFVPSV